MLLGNKPTDPDGHVGGFELIMPSPQHTTAGLPEQPDETSNPANALEAAVSPSIGRSAAAHHGTRRYPRLPCLPTQADTLIQGQAWTAFHHNLTSYIKDHGRDAVPPRRTAKMLVKSAEEIVGLHTKVFQLENKLARRSARLIRRSERLRRKDEELRRWERRARMLAGGMAGEVMRRAELRLESSMRGE